MVAVMKSTIKILVILFTIIVLAGCAGGGGIERPTAAPGSAPTSASTPAPITITGSTPRPIPPTPTLTTGEIATLEYRRLAKGVSAFNPPLEMRVGNAELVTYRIVYGSNTTTPTLVTSLPSTGGPIIISTIKIASRMKAMLNGDTFTIVPLHSSEEKVILPDTPNDWSWQITPTRSGKHTLTLVVSTVIEVGTEKISYDFPVQVRTVTVNVNWGLLVENIMQNSWTQLVAIIGALSTFAGFIYNRLRKRKKPQAKKGQRGRS